MLRKLAAFVLASIVVSGGGIEAFAQAKSRTSPPISRKAVKPSAKPATPARTGKATAHTIRAPKVAQKRPSTSPRRAAVRTPRSAQTLAARRLPSRDVAALKRGSRYGRMPSFAARPLLPPELPPADPDAPRSLSLFNVHTRESIVVTFRQNGRYVQSELDRLNDFLRDSRSAEEVQMDPELFDILWLVRRRLRSEGSFQVLSGYRSPETNAWLASVSRGVASDSLHMRGQAMDVMLPGRTAGQIREAARQLGMGGVGYYPRSGFVHLDTGPVRYW
jgi:uncharacterized protein YcbK (DUF882 family)